MKNLRLYFFLMLAVVLKMTAQTNPNPNFHCNVDASYIERSGKELLKKRGIGRYSQMSLATSSNVRYIPIKLHWVRNTDGSFSKNNDPNIFYDVMLKVNEEYSPIGVQFVVSSEIDFLDNSAYLSTVRGSAEFNAYKAVASPDVVDVWIVDNWIGSPASGYGAPGGVELADLGLQIQAHEFGHFLGLAHTFDTGKGIENVARSGPNKNCDTAGDGICDTNADPYGLTPGQYLGAAPGKAANTCVMNTQTTDKNGDLYDPPYNNYMSYYGYCGFEFTQGQFEAMNAAYTRYHSNYKRLTTGVVSKPVNASIIIENDEEFFTYTPVQGGIGIQLEYSTDNGATWTVMRIKDEGQNKILLTGLIEGSTYKIRSRHLNSYDYSDVISYTPSFDSYCIPVAENKDPNDLVRIGGFSIANTTLNNTSNQNNSYSLTNPADSIIMFPGGKYDFEISVNTTPGGSAGYAFYKIWLDENGDGDFDDNNELKYAQDSKFEFTKKGSFSIGTNAAVGKTRLRIRAFPATGVGGPCDFFSAGETEDYIINIIEDKAPSLVSATFNSQTQAIDLVWSDETDQFGYEIFRSTDGVDFSQKVGEVAAGETTFSDTQILAFTQYGFKVARKSSTNLSEELTVVSGNTSSAYCTPLSQNPCAAAYGLNLKSFTIPDLNFSDDLDAAVCQANNGYSNLTGSDTIKINAGVPHTFNVVTGSGQGFPHLSIFIDLNQNGTFEASEELFKHSNQNQNLGTGTINIPTSAAGGVTALRIRGYFNPFPDACGSSSYGETVDYALQITGGKEPKVRDFAFVPISDTEATLSWQIPVGFGGTGFDIQQSTDGTNFTSVGQAAATATTFNLTGLAPATRYYYRAISTGTINSEPALAWGVTENRPDPTPVITLSTSQTDPVNSAFDVNVSINLSTQEFALEDIEVTNGSAGNLS
jgi:hypothetical protein